PRPQGQRSRDHALARPVDAGLRVDSLSDAQRLLHQLVQQPPDRVVLSRDAVGLAELAEDLRFADHHRVETGCNAKRVTYGIGVVVDVEVTGESAEVQAGPGGENRGDFRESTMKRRYVRMDLDPVAR